MGHERRGGPASCARHCREARRAQQAVPRFPLDRRPQRAGRRAPESGPAAAGRPDVVTTRRVRSGSGRGRSRHRDHAGSDRIFARTRITSPDTSSWPTYLGSSAIVTSLLEGAFQTAPTLASLGPETSSVPPDSGIGARTAPVSDCVGVYELLLDLRDGTVRDGERSGRRRAADAQRAGVESAGFNSGWTARRRAGCRP
jgi:hypothetical protein